MPLKYRLRVGMSVTPHSKYFEFSLWQQSWVQEGHFPSLPSRPAVYRSQMSCSCHGAAPGFYSWSSWVGGRALHDACTETCFSKTWFHYSWVMPAAPWPGEWPSCLKGALKNSGTLFKASCWKNDHCFREQTWLVGRQEEQQQQLDFHSCIRLGQLEVQVTWFCLSKLCMEGVFPEVTTLLWVFASVRAAPCSWLLGMIKSQTLAAQWHLSKVAMPLQTWALYWESCLLRCQELSTDDSKC